MPRSPSAASPELPVASPELPVASPLPAWFEVELTDVRTGESFAVGDFAGNVVLIETMAIWCPTCLRQQTEVRALHESLGSDSDLVSISLDVDPHEDEAILEEYVNAYGYDWRFAVAPLEVARALGNLYSAQYLNPPLAPMLVIDRDGTAFQLPHGVKDADDLRKLLDPHLAD